MSESERELSTNELAARLGIAPDLLRKWKARGLLTKAPQGVSGQGRSVQCFWSEEAANEARAVMASRSPTKVRTRGQS